MNPRIKDLPEDIKKLAIAEMERTFEFSDPNQYLFKAFNWSDSPQGGLFWNHVDSRAYDDARELLRTIEAKKSQQKKLILKKRKHTK